MDWYDRIYSEAAITWCGVDPSLIPTTVTTPIAVPPSAVSGPAWMRVRLWYYDPNDGVGLEADADPTGNIVWGEVEDYQLNIAPAAGGDTTPPETSISSAPPALSNNNSPSVTYTGTDDTTSTPNLLYATFLDGFDAGYSAFGSSTTINYSALADGTYTFNVKAKDEAANEDPSPAQAAFQIDTVQPTITIDDPVDGQVVEGTITVKATASDDIQLDNVEFFVDGALVATDTTAPFEYSWDTTSATNALHRIRAKANDAAGNNNAQAIHVEVLNGPTNLIINPSFELDDDTNNIPDNWGPYGFALGDGRSSDFAQEGNYSLKITGDSTKLNSAKQRIPTGGNTGDVLTFSGWNKTVGASTTGRCVVGIIYLNNVDGSRKSGVIFFDRSTHDWMNVSTTIIADKDYSSIDITIGYFYQTGAAYFDSFSLLRQ